MSMMSLASPQGIKLPRIFQVKVEIKTNVGLQIIPEDYVITSKDIVENSLPFTHKMIMEIPADHPLDISSSTMLMGQLMGAQGAGKGQISGMKDFFLNQFVGDEYNWFISDFDNLMLGNEFK